MIVEPEAADAPPWWEQLPKGRTILLGFVKIDLTASTKEWAELPPGQVAERRERYRAGVESIARANAAASPLNWQGDGVVLFLADTEDHPAPVRAVQVAKLLWERVRLDLNLSARIAVHAARVPWDPETGKLTHPALDHCGHLEGVAPENAVVVSGDVYLVLPEALKQDFAPLGVTTRDGLPAFIYPAKAGERRREDAFRSGDDLQLWDAFRRYVTQSPEIRKLRYVGLRLTKREPPALNIEDVFVPLEVQVRAPAPLLLPEAEAMSGLTREGGNTTDATTTSTAPVVLEEHVGDEVVTPGIQLPSFVPWEVERAASTRQPFRQVFGQSRVMVVLGDPGSGKTTLLRWLAVVAAGGRLAMAHELDTEEWLLPLPVSVGILAAIRSELGPSASVSDALARYFHARNLGEEEELRAFLARRLAGGECLVLLDGLDEVRSAQEREEVRAWLETFAAGYARNRFVVTSRQVGYPGFAAFDATVLVLRPFDDEQVRRYMVAFARAYRRWESGAPADAAADAEAERLLAALRASPRLSALARNPFMLSALALVHRAEGRLPQHRVQFYAIFARALCETWDWARKLVLGTAGGQAVIQFETEAIPILGKLAREMFESHPVGAAPTEFVLSTLAAALVEKRGVPKEEARSASERFLQRAGEETQLLLERGPEQWGFLHLTFQEFFVAAGLHASEEFEPKALAHLYDPRWEEIIRLGVGYLALVQSRPLAAERFVEQVSGWHDTGPRARLYAVLRKHVPLAALLAAEAGDALPEALQRHVAADFARWALDMPSRVADRYLGEIALTDFKEIVASRLIEALRDPDPGARARAAAALGALRAEAAIPALIEALRDPDSYVRGSAAAALGALRAEAAIPALIEALRDPDWYVRGSAAAALGALRAEAAIPALIEALRGPEPNVREAAMEALWRIAETLPPPPAAARRGRRAG